MAGVVSLGLHRPSALPYLIAESILPDDPPQSLYTWLTYSEPTASGDWELLYTSDCVVWSQDGHVKKVYRSTDDNEIVTQALLTTFSPESINAISPSSHKAYETHRTLPQVRWGSQIASGGNCAATSTAGNPPTTSPLAVVILFRTEAHVHFLSGSSHVLALPFQVARAYSSLGGLVIERELNPLPTEASSQSVPPPPPHNSYLFSQSQHTPHSQVKRSTAPYIPKNTYPASPSIPQLEGLYRNILNAHQDQANNDLPHLYSLTSPLSDFAPVSNAAFYRQSRYTRSDDVAEITVEYDALDPAEKLVYVSAKDEMSRGPQQQDSPLMFMVTSNEDTRQITVWQAWYLRPQSLATLLSKRAAHRAARARRRSSFVSNGRATGSITPAVRSRDRVRESLAANAQLPADAPASQDAKAVKSVENEEEAMASSMDPDYVAMKRLPKTSKRVSSLLSRGDLSLATDPSIKQTALGASFGAGSRRGPSIGSFQDRKSFGSHVFRKSRGSTPGSLFSRSIGPDDDFSDSKDEEDLEAGTDHEADDVEQLIEASHRSAGADTAFGSAPDGMRRELVIRKVNTLSLGDEPTPAKTGLKGVKVLSLFNNDRVDQEAPCVVLHILHRSCGKLLTLTYRVQERISQSNGDSRSILIPSLKSRETTSDVVDICVVRDGGMESMLCSLVDHGLRVRPSRGSAWSVVLPRRLSMLNPMDTQHTFGDQKRDHGRTRTIPLPQGPFSIDYVDNRGRAAITSPDGQSHLLQLQLRPRNPAVRQILSICHVVLQTNGDFLHGLWCHAYHQLALGKARMTDGMDPEWEALIISLFTLTAGSIGRSIRVKQRLRHEQSMTPTALDVTSSAITTQAQVRDLDAEIGRLEKSAWSWMQEAQRPKKRQTLDHISPKKPRAKASLREPARYHMVEYEAMARHMLHDLATPELDWLVNPAHAEERALCSAKIMIALHLFREEQKLNVTSGAADSKVSRLLSGMIPQFGHWLGLSAWDSKPGSFYDLENCSDTWVLSDSTMTSASSMIRDHCPNPASIYEWLEHMINGGVASQYLSLGQVLNTGCSTSAQVAMSEQDRLLLPRSWSLQKFAAQFDQVRSDAIRIVELMAECGISPGVLETLPEAVHAPLREAIVRSQSLPSSTWSATLLKLVEREDLTRLTRVNRPLSKKHSNRTAGSAIASRPHDVHTVYATAERAPLSAKTHEAERHAIIALLFSEDRRFVDAARLMNPTAVQLADCPPQPEWSEVEHLEQQKRIMQFVMNRTLALFPGDAMVHFESQRPLLSERFHIRGFSTSCQMKPMDNTISADRSGFTEEKFAWAFFHAGASAGLSISRNAEGIDTSWIVFNKPSDLTNRHAGFLLTLGINGHLRHLAKWLAFKYLTPKHSMTSIGLLLGLSASYLGSMDTLITRMLSVHITRMLPPGAAELNVSPLTQTAGLMGIGLLYYATQHRRMSEVMLSEIENAEIEDPGSCTEVLRDESYRLAAGFALGFINLGKGKDLRGLHGMDLLERLLNVAIGPRPVDLVHVVDRAIAGAVVAVALIYMKTNDQAIARKIDIPDTLAQLEHVRPDILMLRTMAKHVIMWDEIIGDPGWLQRSLPREYAARYYGPEGKGPSRMTRIPNLKSHDIPFYNITTGIAWSLSLKFAGSGDRQARDEVLETLKAFISISKQEAYYYDAKLARNTVKRCIDVLALSAATIMAGTGDLETLRYLRSLHGRTDADTTYGSHLAAHMAIGVLFLGGGTYTFSTSNLAVASLICAFYPLFPNDVLDNRVHLQAFRHFWVFAAESRCIVVQDLDTQRPISLKLKIGMRDGAELSVRSPCLLPDFDKIARISTDDLVYRPVVLDFAANPDHLAAFRREQTVQVRRSPINEASDLGFSSALRALNGPQSSHASRQMWEWILTLPALQDFDLADLDLILPPDAHNTMHLDEKGTVVDTRLNLSKSVAANNRDGLWNLRLLFAWAQDAVDRGGEGPRWIGKGSIDKLKAQIAQRARDADSSV